MLANDAVILRAHGLHFAPAWGSLLVRQEHLAMVLFLPAAALASLTASLFSFALGTLVMLVVIFLVPTTMVSRISYWGTLLWIPPTAAMVVLSAASVAILLWQYARRRTPENRVALGGATVASAVLLIIPPGSWGVWLHTHTLWPPAAVQPIAVRWDPGDAPSLSAGPDNKTILTFRVLLDGLPEKAGVRAELLRLAVDAPDGTRWNSGWRPLFFYPVIGWDRWLPRDKGAEVAVSVDAGVIEKVRQQNASWRLSVILTVLGRSRRESVMPVDGEYRLDGVGVWTISEHPPTADVVTFLSLPASPEVSLSDSNSQSTRPADWEGLLGLGPSPLQSSTFAVSSGSLVPPIPLYVRKPLARLRRDAVATIRLADHQ